jgi:hypothetical protein
LAHHHRGSHVGSRLVGDHYRGLEALTLTRRCACALVSIGAWLFVPVSSTIGAQQPPVAQFIDVDSERERVLRALQLTGEVALYPWTIRAFSSNERQLLTPLNARARALLPPESRRRFVGSISVELLPVQATLVYNSAFPYGFNDGAVWAGRGVTGSVSLGVAARLGPLSVQLEPMVFDAQNQSFALMRNARAANPYANGFYPTSIDLPQRFGNGSYHRFDPGQSSVRLDAGPVAAELSTANQWWGPALQSPIILGNNAPGFVHGMIGTSHPIWVGIGALHARVAYGKLAQSEYSPAQGADTARFMSGLVAVFMPRGARGLELGFARFFHSQWPDSGLSHAPFSRPFEGILKSSLATAGNPTGNSPDNQLAAGFFRWAFPGAAAGLEVYGEFGREDHNADSRDLSQEPDHDAAYSVGIQRAWRRDQRQIVLRGEMLSTRISRLQQGRVQSPWYIHEGSLMQGHTQDGQLLGAAGGFGGGAATIGVDIASASRDGPARWTFEWNRLMRGELRTGDGYPIADGADVMHALSVTRVETRDGTSVSLTAGPVWDFNRDFTHDRFNFTARIAVRAIF